VTEDAPSRWGLFGTGFLQVFFVGLNTYFIAHNAIAGNIVSGFLISYIWTRNVKRAAFGDEKDRWFYASGAAIGSVVGAVTAKALLNADW
jgi:uncharacterized membrane protein YfcA